jgi:hypothetical protein
LKIGKYESKSFGFSDSQVVGLFDCGGDNLNSAYWFPFGFFG